MYIGLHFLYQVEWGKDLHLGAVVLRWPWSILATCPCLPMRRNYPLTCCHLQPKIWFCTHNNNGSSFESLRCHFCCKLLQAKKNILWAFFWPFSTSLPTFLFFCLPSSLCLFGLLSVSFFKNSVLCHSIYSTRCLQNFHSQNICSASRWTNMSLPWSVLCFSLQEMFCF